VKRLREILLGRPKDIHDPEIFRNLSLIAFLAWVGLGADGLSSSCYGPEEAFLALGAHRYLALFLAGLTALTVFVISASYSQIIELFPSGGGGYVVSSHLLGAYAGLTSGCALVVDYMMTISISIASGADALFSFLPPGWVHAKLPTEVVAIVLDYARGDDRLRPARGRRKPPERDRRNRIGDKKDRFRGRPVRDRRHSSPGIQSRRRYLYRHRSGE
jgi:hypothetical protein